MVTPIFKKPLTFQGVPQILTSAYTDPFAVAADEGLPEPAVAAVDSPSLPFGQSITAHPHNAVTPDNVEEVVRQTLADVPHNFGMAASNATLPFETTITNVKKVVEDEYGKPLPRTKMREVYAQADEIVGRLSDAFAFLHYSDIHITHKFHIVKDSKENAFVYSLAGRLRNRRTNMVYITTGLLRKLFSENGEYTEESIERGQYMFAGTMAHEFAHPLDKLDKRGLSRTWSRWKSSQTAELRADVEAVLMLRRAKLPRRGLLDALERIISSREESGGCVSGAVVSTHPEDDLRLSALKIALTLDDFERGDAEVVELSRARDRVIAMQLDRAMPAPGVRRRRQEGVNRFEFPNPTTLLEALETTAVLSCASGQNTLDYWRDHKELMRHCMSCVEAFLIDRGNDLSEEEISKVLMLNEYVIKRWGALSYLWKSDGAKGDSHADVLERIPFYRTERYRAWLRAQAAAMEGIVEVPDEYYGSGDVEARDFIFEWHHTIDGLANVAPVEVLFEEAAPLFNKMVREASYMNYTFIHGIVHSLGEGSPTRRIATSALFFEHVMPHLDSRVLWKLFLVEEHIFEHFDEPMEEWLQQSLRRGLQALWERHGELALIELMRGKRLPWEAIFKVLGKDADAGYEEVAEGVKEFTSSEEYISFVESVPNSPAMEYEHINKVQAYQYKQREVKNDVHPWYRDDLHAYLAGEHNTILKGQPDMLSQARNIVGGAYLSTDVSQWHVQLRRRLAERMSVYENALDQRMLSVDLVVRLLHSAYDSMSVRPEQFERFKGRLHADLAAVLGRLRIPIHMKRQLLHQIYVDVEGFFGKASTSWSDWLGGAGEEGQEIYDVLYAAGVVQGASDLLMKRVESYRAYLERNNKGPYAVGEKAIDAADELWSFTYAYHSKYLPLMKRPLNDEFEAIAQLRDLKERERHLADLFEIVDPFSWMQKYERDVMRPVGYNIYHANGEYIRHLKRGIAKIAATLSLDFAGRLKMFDRLTATGTCPDTDQYFRDHLQDELLRDENREVLGGLLRDGRIDSQRLIVELTRHYLADAMTSEIGKSETRLQEFIEGLCDLAKKQSVFRDELLEDIAWGCDVREDLIGLIEDAKSSNWRKTDPLYVHAASGSSRWANRLDENQRVEMIRYIMNPDGMQCPDEIGSIIDQSWRDGDGKDDATYFFGSREISAVINELRPMQRVPLIAILLEKGTPSLMEREDYPLNISRALLGYETGSDAERILVAAMDSIPPEQDYQKPVVLAYLLSIQNEEKRGIKAIFEAFTAVGIKLGQLASVFWDDVPDHMKDELRELKDNARRLNKAEIYTIMRESLTLAEMGRIKRIKKILGSASLRTAVLVELEDGSEAVMLVQRPYAREQIEANVKRVQRLIPELKKQGFEGYVKVIEAFLQPAVEQLRNELRMTREARVLGVAQDFYGRMNALLRPYLGDWKFAVPGLIPGFRVRDNVMFIGKVEGASFDSMVDGPAKSQAGQGMVMAGLISLFRYGFMNTDPHGGNYLIDPETRTIGVIDWGQFEKFRVEASAMRPDDPYNLTQFLWGIAVADTEKVLKYGLRLNGNTKEALNDATRARLARALRGEADFAGKLIGTINALFESNVKLSRRFAAGAIVGLMILAREGYVDDRSFRHLLSFEAARVIAMKLPLALKAAIKRRFATSARTFLGFGFSS